MSEQDDVREDELKDTEELDEDTTNVETENQEKEGEERKEGEAGEREGEVDPQKRYEPKPQHETVSLKKHLKLKEKMREMQAEIQALKTPSAQNIRDLAKEYGVEESFVTKLAETIETQTVKRVEERLSPILKKQERDKVDQAFNVEFEKLIVNNPKLAGKKEVLKSLAFSPQYLKSSLDVIAAEVFGDLIGTTPTEKSKGGTGDTVVVDFTKVTSDPEVRAKVMADPETKKKYFKWCDENNL